MNNLHNSYCAECNRVIKKDVSYVIEDSSRYHLGCYSRFVDKLVEKRKRDSRSASALRRRLL